MSQISASGKWAALALVTCTVVCNGMVRYGLWIQLFASSCRVFVHCSAVTETSHIHILIHYHILSDAVCLVVTRFHLKCLYRSWSLLTRLNRIRSVCVWLECCWYLPSTHRFGFDLCFGQLQFEYLLHLASSTASVPLAPMKMVRLIAIL